MRWAMSVTQCRTLFADNFEIAQTKLKNGNIFSKPNLYMWILWHLQQCSFSEVWMDVRAPVNSEQVQNLTAKCAPH
ncbi:Glycoprotein hormones alpha chain [Trichinella spiralis]|uniref:Glycoprotein hormones alpha chain n=1 Tax=Trichinella spiralis TaxID=6334 RepID=A0ABR3L1R5_TRISP